MTDTTKAAIDRLETYFEDGASWYPEMKADLRIALTTPQLLAVGLDRARIDIETLRELLRFDPETGVLYWRQTRGKARKDGVAGRADHKGYLKLQIRKGTYAAHRIVWALHYGEWPSNTIDHINGQRADNRVPNLRLATVTENNRNTKKRADNTSGYKGVSLNRKSGKFQAEIHVDGKTIYLGMYDTAEEAHRVYALKAAEHFGEFRNVG